MDWSQQPNIVQIRQISSSIQMPPYPGKGDSKLWGSFDEVMTWAPPSRSLRRESESALSN